MSSTTPMREPETGYWLAYDYRFPTEERAWQAIRDVEGFDVAMAPIRALPEALTREQYALAAAQLHVEEQPDDQIMLVTGCPRPPEASLARCLQTALAKLRQAGIQAERRARPKPEIRYVHCDCGHDVPEGQVMNASLGTSCFSCYDRLSH